MREIINKITDLLNTKGATKAEIHKLLDSYKKSPSVKLLDEEIVEVNRQFRNYCNDRFPDKAIRLYAEVVFWRDEKRESFKEISLTMGSTIQRVHMLYNRAGSFVMHYLKDSQGNKEYQRLFFDHMKFLSKSYPGHKGKKIKDNAIRIKYVELLLALEHQKEVSERGGFGFVSKGSCTIVEIPLEPQLGEYNKSIPTLFRELWKEDSLVNVLKFLTNNYYLMNVVTMNNEYELRITKNAHTFILPIANNIEATSIINCFQGKL